MEFKRKPSGKYLNKIQLKEQEIVHLIKKMNLGNEETIEIFESTFNGCYNKKILEQILRERK
jgi:hypothetical protein